MSPVLTEILTSARTIYHRPLRLREPLREPMSPGNFVHFGLMHGGGN